MASLRARYPTNSGVIFSSARPFELPSVAVITAQPVVVTRSVLTVKLPTATPISFGFSVTLPGTVAEELLLPSCSELTGCVTNSEPVAVCPPVTELGARRSCTTSLDDVAGWTRSRLESGAFVPTCAEIVAQPAAPATVVTGKVLPPIGAPFLIEGVIEAGTVATEALLLERCTTVVSPSRTSNVTAPVTVPPGHHGIWRERDGLDGRRRENDGRQDGDHQRGSPVD